MKQVKSIVLDINKKYYGTIETKDKDTARYLLFKLLDDGVPFDLTGKKVRAYSSYEKFNDLVTVDAKNGLCELKLTTEFLGKAGFNKVELTIYEGLETLSTMLFCINNIACLRDDSAIESTNEFSALTIALNKVEQLEKNLEEASTDLEKKYTDRLNGIESTIKDNKLTDLETDANLTKLNSVVDGNLIVDKIQGRTLVNNILTTAFIDENGYCTAIGDTTNLYKKVYCVQFKPSTDYTIIFDVLENTLESRIRTSSGEVFPQDTIFINAKQTGRIVVKLRSNNTFPNLDYFNLVIESSASHTQTNKIKFKMMLFEGEVQNPPAYFTGIKSVGEDNQNKIEVITHGKNLFDKTKVTLNKYVSDASGELADTHDANASDFIPILPNTEYIIFSPNEVKHWGAIYDVNKQYIKGVTSYNTFTTPSNARYFRCTVLKDNMDTYQLEEKQATNYEPYKEDESEILLSSPLREFDYIDKDGVHRNSIQITLGDATWSCTDWNNGYIYAQTETYDELVKSNTNVIACNKLPIIDSFNEVKPHTKEAIRSTYTRFKVRLSIAKTNLKTLNSGGVNEYLKSAKITALFATATETIEPLNSPLTLQTFKDGYSGLNSGAINPVVSLRFPTNMGERLKATEEALTATKKDYYSTLKTLIQTADKVLQLELNKQDKMDSTLTTVDKTIVGAIKENKSAIDNSKIDITNLQKDATVIPFPFDTNFSNHSAYSQYIKKNGLVCIIIDVQKKDNTSLGTDWVKIGKVPREIIPTNTIDGYAMTYPAQEPTALRVLDTGDVFILVKSQEQKYAYGSINFYAKGGTI